VACLTEFNIVECDHILAEKASPPDSHFLIEISQSSTESLTPEVTVNTMDKLAIPDKCHIREPAL
jgi:hypothetical protein